jgi:hypothetical protein
MSDEGGFDELLEFFFTTASASLSRAFSCLSWAFSALRNAISSRAVNCG